MWSRLREIITYALILNVLYFSSILWKFWRSFQWLFTKLHQFIYGFVQSLLHFWQYMFTGMIKKIFTLIWKRFHAISFNGLLCLLFMSANTRSKVLFARIANTGVSIDLTIMIKSSDDLIELDIWNTRSINNAKNRSRK